MTKPIIGIIGRRAAMVNKNHCEGNIVLYNYLTPLDNVNASYIGLITNNRYDVIDDRILDLCDGILMIGGIEIKSYHIKIIEYAIKNGIPFLGICLGCQALGLSTLTGANLLNLDNELSNNTHVNELVYGNSSHNHKVHLKENSLLYNLFGSTISVNSNHHYALPKVSEPMIVTGTSEDGVIEAIEHIDPNIFAVGVQWHPEYMESMQPLFEEFVNRAKNRSK